VSLEQKIIDKSKMFGFTGGASALSGKIDFGLNYSFH